MRPSLPQSQPEERTATACCESVGLLGPVHGGRFDHIRPAGGAQVRHVCLQHPAGDVGAPDQFHIPARLADDEGRCACLLQGDVLGEKAAAHTVAAAGRGRAGLRLGDAAGHGEVACHSGAAATTGDGVGGDGVALRVRGDGADDKG